MHSQKKKKEQNVDKDPNSCLQARIKSVGYLQGVFAELIFTLARHRNADLQITKPPSIHLFSIQSHNNLTSIHRSGHLIKNYNTWYNYNY